MDNREITKAVLKDENLTQVQFCEQYGIKSQGALSSKMNHNYTTDSMYRLLAPLGYELVIRKKGKRKPTEYVVEVRTLED